MIWLGVLVALGAAVANAFAVVLQAAEDRRAPREQAGRLSLFAGLAHRPRWLAGTGLMILAWPLQLLALGLAPITVVQPLLSTTQLVLLAVARVRLRERVGRRELAGALAIVLGVAAVVWAAPRHTVRDPAAVRVAVPLLAVGAGTVVAFLVGRVRVRAALAFVIGAGLAYAWVDFANKLLADDLSTGHWAYAALWLVGILLFGALAFLAETTALQRRTAIGVAPVVGAIHDPLPVVMALGAGVEVWAGTTPRIIPLICGLTVIAAGAAILGSSRAVARVSGDPQLQVGTRRRLAGCARQPGPPMSGPPRSDAEVVPSSAAWNTDTWVAPDCGSRASRSAR